MQDEFKVYGRAGEPCERCGTPIEKIRVGGRGTWYCPSCQRPGARARSGLARTLDLAGWRRHVQDRGGRAALVPASARPTACCTSTRSTAAASARSRRACARRSRASARGSSRSATSSCMLHQGSGELQTVTGVELVRSHHAAREEPYRLGVGLIGAEAMLRLFTEQEANERAFRALTRFLDLLDELEPRDPARRGARPARALVPAEAALALRLPAAPDELRRVRRRGRARRLLAAGRRRRLRELRAAALALSRGRARRDRRASAAAARRGGRRRPHRPRRAARRSA